MKLSDFPWAFYLGEGTGSIIVIWSDKDGTIDDGWSIAAPLATYGRFSLTSLSQVSPTSPSRFLTFYTDGHVETAPWGFPCVPRSIQHLTHPRYGVLSINHPMLSSA